MNSLLLKNYIQNLKRYVNDPNVQKLDFWKEKYESMFLKANSEEKRYLFELSILLNWQDKVEVCLKNGVDPNGCCVLNDLVNQKIQNVLEKPHFKTMHYLESIIFNVVHFNFEIIWTPLTMALQLNHFKIAELMMEKANLGETCSVKNRDRDIEKSVYMDFNSEWSPLLVLLNLGKNKVYSKIKMKLIHKVLKKHPIVDGLDPLRPYYASIFCISNNDDKMLKLLEPFIQTWNEKDEEGLTRMGYFLRKHTMYTSALNNPKEVDSKSNMFKILLKNSVLSHEDEKIIEKDECLKNWRVEYEKELLNASIPSASKLKSKHKIFI